MSVWNNELLITISNTLHNTSTVPSCVQQPRAVWPEVQIKNNSIIWFAKVTADWSETKGSG